MTGGELIRETARRTGYTIAVCDEIIKEVFEIMAASLESYEDVKIAKFGTFSVYDRKPRRIYNHSTHQINYIDGYKCPKFVPSAQLKEAVKS